MKRFLLIFGFFFQLLYAFGQWQPVTLPAPIYSLQFAPQSFGVQFPVSSLPLSNGEIIYSAHISVSPSLGGWGDVFTADDFGNIHSPVTSSAVPSQNCLGCTHIFLGSLNDSTFCQYINGPGYNEYKYGSLYGTFGAGGLLHLSNTMTMKFIYSCKPENGDTLVLYRTLVSPTYSQTTFKMQKYKGIPNLMQFVNDSVGYMAARYKSDTTKNVLLKTNDFGATWVEVYIDSISNITTFHFPSATIGYLANDNGQVSKSIDGGLNWVLTPNTSLNHITSIKFINDSVGYIGGYLGALGKTLDGGNSWAAENSGTSSEIMAFYNFGEVVYFSTINYGRGLFKNSAKTQGIKESPTDKITFDMFPNPSTGKINIAFPESTNGSVSIRISDLLGYEVYEGSFGCVSSKTIDISNLMDGLYIVNLRQGKTTVTKKLLLRKD